MRILVTNDDGVHAPALWALVRALAPLGHVVVAVPDREQSGVGTSITLLHPLRVVPFAFAPVDVPTWVVEGTPADCVVLGLGIPLIERPDLLVSGINQGANLGNDVLISGTVGAAIQGFFYGVPSIAVSLSEIHSTHMAGAAAFTAALANEVGQGLLAPGGQVFLNVNVPDVPMDEIEGVEVTRLGRRSYVDVVQSHRDTRGRDYYWITRGKPDWDMEAGTDIHALLARRISVTPLQSDMASAVHAAPLREVADSLLAAARSAERVGAGDESVAPPA